jgi:hypothetical protein
MPAPTYHGELGPQLEAREIGRSNEPVDDAGFSHTNAPNEPEDESEGQMSLGMNWNSQMSQSSSLTPMHSILSKQVQRRETKELEVHESMLKESAYFQTKYPNSTLQYARERDQLNPMLYDFLQHCDFNHNGSLTPSSLDQMSDIVKTTLQAKEHNSAELDYSNFPACVKKVMRKFDFNDDGHVSVEELSRAAELWEQNQKQKKFLLKIVGGLIVVLFLLASATFASTLVAVELTKELETGRNGVIMSSAGGIARISSADTEIVDGMLMPLGNSSSSPTAIKTADVEFKRRLSSTTPDHILNGLKKITIADGSMSLGLQILGFSRITTPSKCGSLVHLKAPDGKIVIDDTDIHFDTALTAYLEQSGITVDEVSVHGRRLSSAASLEGYFGFWEEYTWECTAIQKPVSPQNPYMMKILRKHPCLSHADCTSKVSQGDGPLAFHSLPGYDANTNTIVTEETIISTDEYTMSVVMMPNHIGQKLVSVTDHVGRTHVSKQIYGGSAYKCMSKNYTDAIGNASNDLLSKYFASFIASGPMDKESIALPWGSVHIPARTVRHFRLSPLPDTDDDENEDDNVDGDDADALPITIDYYDEVGTLKPVRMYMNMAREFEMDTQEILIVSYETGAEASAAGLSLKTELNISCMAESEDGVLGLPSMISPFEEDDANVKFYVEDLQLQAQTQDPYWLNAVQDPLLNGTVARRLMSPSRRLGDTLDRWTETIVDVTFGSGSLLIVRDPLNGGCTQGIGTFTPRPDGNGWSLSGELTVGKGCYKLENGEYPNSPLVQGRVDLCYKMGIQKTFMQKVAVDCALSMCGYVGATVGSHSYSCRRLSVDSPTNTSFHGGTRVDDPVNDLTEVTEELTEESESVHAGTRKLATCSKTGYTLDAGVYIEGGCSASIVSRRRRRKGIGVSLSGGLDLKLGPFPEPLDARAKAEISVEACVKIIVQICFKLSGIQIFDLNIPDR